MRSLDGVWIVCEGHGAMPDGGMAATLMTIGYDAAKARCVGTFVGTMMTTSWVYEGTLDTATDTMKLYSEGPSFIQEARTGKYMDVTELKSDDHRVFSSYYLNDQSEWERFMTTHYYRSAKFDR